MHSTKEVVFLVHTLYSTLTSWPTAQMRCFFTEIFLRDLQPISSFSGQGFHGLPLLPPVANEEPREKAEAAPAVCKPHLGKSESSNPNCGYDKCARRPIRRALFAIRLLDRLVKSGIQAESNGEEVRRIWNITSTESLRSRGVLQHRILTMKVLQLLKDSYDWLVENRISMKGIMSALEYISSMITSETVKHDDELAAWFLVWVTQLVEKSPAAVASDSRLVELIIDLSDSNDEKIRLRTGEVIQKLSSAYPGVGSSTVQKLAVLAAKKSSDTIPLVSRIFEEALVNLSPCALLIGSEGNRYRWDMDSSWAAIATGNQMFEFQPAQLTNFLQHLTHLAPGEGSSFRLLQDMKQKVDVCSNWIHVMVESLTVRYSVEGVDCIRVESIDNVRHPLPNQHNTQTMLWFLVHEAARNCVNTKFRLQNGGPSQFFSLLEGALSSLATKLSKGSKVDFTNTWMLLEFISALEKLCYCGYEGSDMLPSPPESTWQFYLGNRKVFVEWFSRLHQKLLFISQKLGHHHFTVNAFVCRIHQLSLEQSNLMENADEAWV